MPAFVWSRRSPNTSQPAGMRCRLVALPFFVCLVAAQRPDPRAAESVIALGRPQQPPALDKRPGKVVTVRTEPQLQSAVRALKSGTTVLIAPGIYQLTNTLNIDGGLKDVALRGDTRDHGNVVLKG